jgi:DNA-binding NarL/FixJ family response regulator
VIVDNFVKGSPAELAKSTQQLSPREKEVLQLIADGKNTKEIATIINISTKTVETYRQQLMKKLNIFNIATLTKYAVREGLSHID